MLASHRSPSRRRGLIATVLAFSLLTAACGGSKANDTSKDVDFESEGLNSAAGESGLEDAGKPERGGTIVYALEADSAGGYCLAEAQLAISGMMVVRAFYDPLTAPNSEGEFVPYLAKSVTSNDDFTEWTIGIRKGIKFHDGTDLTAEVVRNNIDAYRGTYEGRSPLLFAFILSNIESTEVKGDTVVVKTKVPWVAFPSFLNLSSRFGIMAQSQLDDPTSCSEKLVGTGPFVFKSWSKNDKIIGERNANYWQTAPDGKPYPYAEGIEYRFIPDGDVRLNSLESSTGANAMHTTGPEQIGGKLKELRDAGKVNMLVSEDDAEVSFVQLNSTKPPFNDARMRRALALAADRKEINDLLNDGLPTVAEGPFYKDSPGYLEDTGFPQYDLEAAKKLIAEYTAEGNKAEFTLTSTNDTAIVRIAEMIQQKAQEVGVKVTIIQRDQAALVNDAIGKEYQAMVFRNYPGGDPDANYVWWYGEGNPVNFGGFDDPVINKLLDEGRSEPDKAKRAKIYQDLNRQFAKEVWSVWAWFTPWAVAVDGDVHNILGPPLPGEDPSKPGELTSDDPALQPRTGLATGHSLLGMWIEQ
ncbi:MAG: ABC transporter substrate-binding protein [Acidimicrobiales bacterium]|nr:ABC transporter substrate-binding protein [Acidimicrobiales bacterium]